MDPLMSEHVFKDAFGRQRQQQVVECLIDLDAALFAGLALFDNPRR